MTHLAHDAVFQLHDTGTHPENAGRLRAIDPVLQDADVLKHCETASIEPATIDQIALVHGKPYIESLKRLATQGGGRPDPDTVVSPKSYEVALAAAGAACGAVDLVMKENPSNALCLVRPPGHHALADKAMGFCLFNNVAVAARHAQAAHQVGRILIVDWDVHHGNGTQDIFYDDGDVVFFSIHRFPFYPGSGDSDETGTGAGLGATFNAPISFGTSRKKYFETFEAMLSKAVQRANPELILISAGFDAHREDPIGSLGLETEDFGRLTKIIKEVAEAECGGRIVSLLEGGYNPQALADSVKLHLEVLAET